MSWLATKYAWKCRNEAVKGSVRLVLLALALRVKTNYIDTVPTSLSVLRRLTFLSDDTITAAIKVLCIAGEVRRVRRGKYAIYAMAKMAGPLFAENPQDAAFFEHEKNPQDAAFLTRKMREFSAAPAGGVLLSDRTCTEVPTSSKALEPLEEEEVFFYWFLAEFEQRRGCRYHVKRVPALKVIRELLQGRSVARLQAMAVLMLTAERDQFIVNSDRGLWVLEHKQTYLEGIAIQNERQEAAG